MFYPSSISSALISITAAILIAVTTGIMMMFKQTSVEPVDRYIEQDLARSEIRNCNSTTYTQRTHSLVYRRTEMWHSPEARHRQARVRRLTSPR